MQNSWKSFIMLFGLLLSSACSPSLSEAEMTATQQALYSPTPTVTVTPTATLTTTPTITPTPTATPVPVEVEIQDNGTTLVRIPGYGFQFVLPRGWTYAPPGAELKYDSLGAAELEIPGGSNATLDVTDEGARGNFQSYLERMVDINRSGFGFTIHRTGETINLYNVSMGYLEASGQFGSTPIHFYSIYFLANGRLIEFGFWNSVNAIYTAIAQIQASIQLID